MKRNKIVSFILAIAFIFGATGCQTGTADTGATDKTVKSSSETNYAVTYEQSAPVITAKDSMLVREWLYDDPDLYVRPYAPNGKEFSVVSGINYERSSINYMYVERTEETCAAEYGYTARNNGDGALYICTVGGNSLPGISYWNYSIKIENATGFMAFVDFRNLKTDTAPEFGVGLYVSETGDKYVIEDLLKTELKDKTECLYYDYDGEWKSAVSDGKRVPLPDGFVGYVYIPASGYEAISDGGKFGSYYLQHVKIYYDIADKNECATTILTDDLVFVAESGDIHAHDYEDIKTVGATCVSLGYDLNRCKTCGQTKKTNETEIKEHSYGKTFALGDGSGAICSYCKDLKRSDEPSLNKADTYNVTFSYGEPVNKDITLAFPENYVIKQKDVPWIYRGKNTNKWGITDYYQFFAYNSTPDYDELINPVGYKVTGDVTFYGTYNRYSYDNEHFGHMFKQVATHGGPYNAKNLQGKTVFIGNSNYMLWWSMEYWYAQRGIEVLNNSVAGGTCYDFLEFIEELVYIYHPKVVVMGVSSNDFCYHQLTDAEIIKNELKFMDKVRKICPGVSFIVGSMNPLPGRPEYFSSIKRINQKFDDLCKGMNDAIFIDTSAKVWEFCKQYPDGWSFWTHMDEEKLSVILGDMMIGTIKSYLAYA